MLCCGDQPAPGSRRTVRTERGATIRCHWGGVGRTAEGEIFVRLKSEAHPMHSTKLWTLGGLDPGRRAWGRDFKVLWVRSLFDCELDTFGFTGESSSSGLAPGMKQHEEF